MFAGARAAGMLINGKMQKPWTLEGERERIWRRDATETRCFDAGDCTLLMEVG